MSLYPRYRPGCHDDCRQPPARNHLHDSSRLDPPPLVHRGSMVHGEKVKNKVTRVPHPYINDSNPLFIKNL